MAISGKCTGCRAFEACEARPRKHSMKRERIRERERERKTERQTAEGKRRGMKEERNKINEKKTTREGGS